MPSNHLILCQPLLLLPSIFPDFWSPPRPLGAWLLVRLSFLDKAMRPTLIVSHPISPHWSGPWALGYVTGSCSMTMLSADPRGSPCWLSSQLCQTPWLRASLSAWWATKDVLWDFPVSQEAGQHVEGGFVSQPGLGSSPDSAVVSGKSLYLAEPQFHCL